MLFISIVPDDNSLVSESWVCRVYDADEVPIGVRGFHVEDYSSLETFLDMNFSPDYLSFEFHGDLPYEDSAYWAGTGGDNYYWSDDFDLFDILPFEDFIE